MKRTIRTCIYAMLQRPNFRFAGPRPFTLGGFFLCICSFALGVIFPVKALAQWQSIAYTLHGGWNAIYLHGDATHATPDQLFLNSPEVVSVWRWNPSENAVQITGSSLIPSTNTADWSVWRRGALTQTLAALTGQNAYLVECSGAVTNSYSISIPQRILPPRSVWLRNGANFHGFPSRLSNGYPAFSLYFASFPAAIAADTKVYKYGGGELGPANPIPVFSLSGERVDRTQAYWFDAQVVGDFYSPIEVTPSMRDGLHFGRSGALINVRVRNRTTSIVTLRVDPVDSASAPLGQETIAGAVPLTRRTYVAATASYAEASIGNGFSEPIAPGSSLDLTFGIDRSRMSAVTDSFYASLLRFTDSSNLIDVYLPVTAHVASLTGLWVGDVTVTNVESKAPGSTGVGLGVLVTNGGSGYISAPMVSIFPQGSSGGAAATAQLSGRAVSAVSLKVSSTGAKKSGAGYSSPPTVTISGGGGSDATAIAQIGENGLVTGFIVTNGGSGYTSAPDVVLTGGGGTGAEAEALIPGGAVASLTLLDAGGTYSVPPSISIVGGGGLGATATPVLSARALSEIKVTNGGSGYTATPTVTITGDGTDAAGTAHIFPGKVAAVAVTSGGRGYTAVPTVTFSGGGGTGAVATAQLTVGPIASVMVTNGGSGYTTAPAVTFSDGTGSATAQIAGGRVTSITVTQPGSYSIAPTVLFANGGGTGAAATVNLSWGVSALTVTNGGSGYKSVPAVTFSGGGGTGAAADAILSRSVSGVTLSNGGSGYTSEPIVTLVEGGGSGATATAQFFGGRITGIVVTNGGTGYATAPTVVFSGGGGAGAIATAQLSAGAIRGFIVTNPGSGYSSPPTVTISGGEGANGAATALLNAGQIAGITVANGGAGYTTVPTVGITGGGATTVATAAADLAAVPVGRLDVESGGSGYTAAPTVSFSGGGGTGAEATAQISGGSLTGFTILNGGSGYTIPPIVVVSGGGGAGGRATARLAAGQISGVTITNPGTGYTVPPAISFSGPGTGAVATAQLAPGKINGLLVTNGGSGYTSAPRVLIGGQLGAGAAATAQIGSDGKVVGVTITKAGSNYLVPPEIVISGGGGSGATAVAEIQLAGGTTTARSYALRTLLHVDQGGIARLLPQVFIGRLSQTPNDVGLSTLEARLLPSDKARAARLFSVHLPLDTPISAGSGSVALGGTLVRTIVVPFDDRTNPFVHKYHPDHDNKDARFERTLSDGEESYTIRRTCTFNFSATPPPGSSVVGWGSAVIGGTYSETIDGLHKDPLTVTGTFELRRVSEIGTLTTN